MADLVLPVNVGSLASGFCPSTYQEMANAFAAIYSVTLAQGTGITIIASASKPTDTTAVWLKLDSLGRPERLYYFAQGAWLSLHPAVPGTTIIWTSALPNFQTFDGGDNSGVISAISGEMWKEVEELRARFPIGAGTLPSGTVLAVGDTGGEEKHTLTQAELPVHNHFAFKAESVGDAAPNVSTTTYAARTFDDNDDNVERYRVKGTTNTADVGLTGNVGNGESHQNLPPYLTVYFLRRTDRLFYAEP